MQGSSSENEARVSFGSYAMQEDVRERMVGSSSALDWVLRQVEAVTPTTSMILIQGETGTGKELVAQAIHNLSPRRDGRFVVLNCGAIPSGLLESELFGHERGAFTGALSQQVGRFQLADRGTLFLDEGELPLELQPKLLRALQSTNEPKFRLIVDSIPGLVFTTNA